jgi:uncharacterized membrane protein
MSNGTSIWSEDRLRRICFAIYGVQGLTVLCATIPYLREITSAAMLFVVFLGYFTRRKVAGMWLESHWRYQIRTFWHAMILSVSSGLVFVFGIVLTLGKVADANPATMKIAFIMILATMLLVIYRAGRGFLAMLYRRSI